MKKNSRKPLKRKIELKLKLNLKNVLSWLLIFLLIGFLISSFLGPLPTDKKSLSDVLLDIKEGKVERVEVEDEQLFIKYKDDDNLYESRKEGNETFVEILERSGIDPEATNFEIKDQSIAKAWANVLELLLPVILTGLIFLFIFRQMRGAQDSIFSFGRSKAKLFAKGKQEVRFKDVGGVDEAKQELEEVVDFLKHPKKYRKLGARTPKGVLLVGHSGTGKTLLARAVAGEAGVPFFSMAGSEFMEMLVGVGASRVRDLFATAKKAAPAIIFIDEIDAIGRMRGVGVAGGHDEREQTLNQILVEMDGFTPNDHVIVLAATNRGDLLDPALMRPGRFDRRVTLDLPDIEGRKKIILIHAQGKPFAKKVSWESVARRTVGFSGADLENMLNEAAIQAARHNKSAIDPDDLEEAATRVKLGPEKKRLQSKNERLMTAYHEAGHAIVAHMLPTMDPIHRVSIISRGLSLGYTLIPPEKDRYQETETELLEQAVSLLGGRAAEKLQFNELTGGAASDIDKVTRLARRMVIDYGMSRLGPIYLGPQMETADWGKNYYQPTDLSEELKAKVDQEIKRIVDESYQKALETLKKHKKLLDKVAAELVKVESLDGDQFEQLLGVKKARVKEFNGD